jgi:ankyrin repeat protein
LQDGIGPLTLASQLGFPDVVRDLIDHGADVDATNRVSVTFTS